MVLSIASHTCVASNETNKASDPMKNHHRDLPEQAKTRNGGNSSFLSFLSSSSSVLEKVEEEEVEEEEEECQQDNDEETRNKSILSSSSISSLPSTTSPLYRAATLRNGQYVLSECMQETPKERDDTDVSAPKPAPPPNHISRLENNHAGYENHDNDDDQNNSNNNNNNNNNNNKRLQHPSKMPSKSSLEMEQERIKEMLREDRRLSSSSNDDTARPSFPRRPSGGVSQLPQRRTSLPDNDSDGLDSSSSSKTPYDRPRSNDDNGGVAASSKTTNHHNNGRPALEYASDVAPPPPPSARHRLRAQFTATHDEGFTQDDDDDDDDVDDDVARNQLAPRLPSELLPPPTHPVVKERPSMSQTLPSRPPGAYEVNRRAIGEVPVWIQQQQHEEIPTEDSGDANVPPELRSSAENNLVLQDLLNELDPESSSTSGFLEADVVEAPVNNDAADSEDDNHVVKYPRWKRFVPCAVAVGALVLGLGVGVGVAVGLIGRGSAPAGAAPQSPAPPPMPPPRPTVRGCSVKAAVQDACLESRPVNLTALFNDTACNKTVERYHQIRADFPTENEPGSCDASNQATWWLASSWLNVTDLHYVLLTLFFATNGKSWEVTDQWLQNGDVCQWHGIDCTLAGVVEKIELPQNNLNGTIPIELERLTTVREYFLLGVH